MSRSFWRKLHLVLCVVVAAIALIRLVTGNVLGAIIPIALALVFASIAFDYPLWQRLRRLGRLVTRIFRR